jgi:hypothetical protein
VLRPPQTAPAVEGDLSEPYAAGWGDGPDTTRDAAAQVLQGLGSDDWRTRTAAAERAGRLKLQAAVPALVALYKQEEAEPHLYDAVTRNWPFSKMKISFGGWAEATFPEPPRRRYRLKTAILEALGRIGDRDAAKPLILRTLAKPMDFYPVLVQACIAAVRLDLPETAPDLQRLTRFGEVNTAHAAQLAADVFAGCLTPFEFEQHIAMP